MEDVASFVLPYPITTTITLHGILETSAGKLVAGLAGNKLFTRYGGKTWKNHLGITMKADTRVATVPVGSD